MIFSGPEQRILGAFVEAMVARDEDGVVTAPPPEHRDLLVTELDDWVSHVSPTLPIGFRLVTWVIEFLPLFIVGAFARMSSLELAARVRYLEAVEHSRLGLVAMALTALKVPVSILAYELQPDLRRTGFDRPALTSLRVKK